MYNVTFYLSEDRINKFDEVVNTSIHKTKLDYLHNLIKNVEYVEEKRVKFVFDEDKYPQISLNSRQIRDIVINHLDTFE